MRGVTAGLGVVLLLAIFVFLMTAPGAAQPAAEAAARGGSPFLAETSPPTGHSRATAHESAPKLTKTARGELASLLILEDGTGFDFEAQRRGMVAALQVEALLAARHTGLPSFDTRVLDAMAEVPRHDFVPRSLRPLSYLNRPLPLGWDLEMPSPFLTALMAQVAEIEPHERVLQTELRIGYQTAVLARLAERVDVGSSRAAMASHARSILLRLGISNVGLCVQICSRTPKPQEGYDAILVERAARKAPEDLLARLRPEGRLVFPRLEADGGEVLSVVTRLKDGSLESRDVLPLRLARPGTST